MDLPLSDELYQRFRALLVTRAGLAYPDQRRTDLTHNLSQAANDFGLADLATLYVEMAAGGALWEQALTHLTIGETYFFRNAAQFAALREHILPELMRRRGPVRSLRLWSAGCATGEEPYSLAMTLADALPPNEAWQVSILATDLNVKFLERAREALYGSWSFRDTPEATRERFFTADGPRWRLKPELRRQVIFVPLNLAEPSYPLVANGTVALDMIFCRNVTIYFDEATTRQVAERFYGALAPGGWLVVGHAEPHAETYRAFETYNVPGAVLYRKPLNAPAFVTVSPGLPAVALPPPNLQPVKLSPARTSTPQVAPVQRAAPPVALLDPPTPPAPDPLVAGWVAANRGDWTSARHAAEIALAVTPLRAAPHFLLGQVFENTGDLDAALSAYRRSVYLDPTWVLGSLGMVGIWQKLGNRAEARRGLRGVLLQLSRRNPDALVPGADGRTVAEVVAYARAQLDMLG